ncbi:MAG TPA: hypothetical protein PKE37_04720 [Thiomonas arsenitoxydans]|uniref:hypothetical protein n=1 Tax=Thiomonas TaxID=32012 RepID=UPI00257CDF34|nr:MULTISPECIES: hypothetical protein [Thiomonas]HML81056.1 hypothetical protein [Thiomonas arsenitoxydans]
MNPIKIFGAVLPLLVGMAAALWTPLSFWFDMKEGLIAFLGFLAASLVQVMPLTANFLQSDRLSPREAERLTASLTKQQHYWMGLLSAAIAAMAIVIVGAALTERVKGVGWTIDSRHFELGQLVCFFIASSISFVLVKMLGLFEGLMSLHRLRGELVLNAAKREAAEKAAVIQHNAEMPGSIVPTDYGSVLRPH